MEKRNSKKLFEIEIFDLEMERRATEVKNGNYEVHSLDEMKEMADNLKKDKEYKALKKLRSKKRFRKRQHEKAIMLELKDLAKKLKNYTQGKSLKDRLIKEESERYKND
jgi:hypothetical protein